MTTPQEFCDWFAGVLDMAEGEDGNYVFTLRQAAKIQTKLKEALAAPTTPTLPPMFPGRPDNVRC